MCLQRIGNTCPTPLKASSRVRPAAARRARWWRPGCRARRTAPPASRPERRRGRGRWRASRRATPS
eukprot:6196410-Pleurochrysis_carterae.AAC.1